MKAPKHGLVQHQMAQKALDWGLEKHTDLVVVPNKYRPPEKVGEVLSRDHSVEAVSDCLHFIDMVETLKACGGWSEKTDPLFPGHAKQLVEWWAGRDCTREEWVVSALFMECIALRPFEWELSEGLPDFVWNLIAKQYNNSRGLLELKWTPSGCWGYPI